MDTRAYTVVLVVLLGQVCSLGLVPQSPAWVLRQVLPLPLPLPLPLLMQRQARQRPLRLSLGCGCQTPKAVLCMTIGRARGQQPAGGWQGAGAGAGDQGMGGRGGARGVTKVGRVLLVGPHARDLAAVRLNIHTCCLCCWCCCSCCCPWVGCGRQAAAMLLLVCGAGTWGCFPTTPCCCVLS